MTDIDMLQSRLDDAWNRYFEGHDTGNERQFLRLALADAYEEAGDMRFAESYRATYERCIPEYGEVK